MHEIEKALPPLISMRIARSLSCSVLIIDGVFHKMFIPYDAETARERRGDGEENERGVVDAPVIHDDVSRRRNRPKSWARQNQRAGQFGLPVRVQPEQTYYKTKSGRHT